MSNIPEPPVSLAVTPTPLNRLDHLSEEIRADLYVKRDDMTASIAQGNKIRKLEYLLGEATQRGADAVITMGGLQSNHCRTTAVGARQLNLQPVLLLRGEEPTMYDGNFLLDRILGAEIEWISSEAFGEQREETFTAAESRLADRGYTPYVIPVGGSSGLGSLGYLRAYQEIHDWAAANDVSFDRIFFATGSAGTQAGLIAGTQLFGDDVDIVGVNVGNHTVSQIINKIRDNISEMDELLETTKLDPAAARDEAVVFTDYHGPEYGEPTEADLTTIQQAGQKEGIVLDPTYTGKAFRAFLEESDPGETNLFVHTGGSYGLFPKRERLTTAIKNEIS